MRRLFYVLGIVFTVVTVGVVGFIAIAFHQGSALDVQSKAYVERMVADLGRDWDRTELLKRASPGLLKQASGERIETLFQRLRALGSLVHYDGANGQAMMFVSVGQGSTVRAHYEAKARFRNGSARFRVDLSRRNAQWVVDGFFVDVTPPPDMSLIVKPI